MHPAEQPTDPERGYRRRVRLRLNPVAQPCVERACGLSRNVGALAVQVLRGPCGLIHDAFDLGFGIARRAADALLDLAADITHAAFQSILVHACSSKLSMELLLAWKVPRRIAARACAAGKTNRRSLNADCNPNCDKAATRGLALTARRFAA